MKKIAYMFDKEVGLFNYGPSHPMNPIRVTMTHSLVHSYGLDRHMDIYKPTPTRMTYHTNKYINNLGIHSTEDCPAFDGLNEYCERYSSASINAAQLLNTGENDIVINWSGGFHHAKKEEASGFCYLNDIVMCIQRLLTKHRKVMYIDIDVHHGDGVEEAFYHNDRVLTVSFHKHGENFFPETGELVINNTKAVNVPLKSGITDEGYRGVYEPIISNCIKNFKPDAIVFQSGADSLIGDKIGVFSLSLEGHGNCLRYLLQYNIPMVVLGGGGYTVENVSRLWTYETSILCDTKIPDFIPYEDSFFSRYPSNSLTNLLIENNVGVYKDMNSRKYLSSIMSFIQTKIDKF
ncbi:HDAC1 [Hepatospora eriocheir]|uniref:histone deacetylase n=1 Tax=Hepatospora eriocheir TaxID=1081669 RepID=A0A1X0QLL3_9MICR|nr:HDAC1 [Hepatospora eriocheir]